jgi:hypothetical protein
MRNRTPSISVSIQKSNSVSPKKQINTYSIEDISSLFDARGIDYKRVGREVNADIDRIGHRSYKINPRKGKFFNTNNENDKGPIAKLLKRLSVENPAILATGSRSSDSDSRQKQVEINQIIRNSISFEKSNEDVKNAVGRYFQGRGLTCILPAETRISAVNQGYDLIVPLFSFPVVNAKAPATAVHITYLTKKGEKRPQDWLDGNHRAIKGRLKDRHGFHVYNSIAGAQERLNVNGMDWIGIGEGLETVISGRVLTGWSSVFAQSTSGLTAFLENPAIVERFQADRIGLAIFVERDISGAGQKASASLARKAKEAGIPVLFLVPPSIIKGGKKGADWNDAVIELNEDGAKAALMLAISRSEEELSKTEDGKIVPIDNVRDVRDSEEELSKTEDGKTKTVSVEIARIHRIPVDEAFFATRKNIKDYLDNKQTAPVLLQIDMGVGKSHILSDLSRDHLYVGDPLAIITPTKTLAQEAAQKSGGLFREGRSDDATRAGFCFIYPEVEPFSDKMRSIVAHKCSSCDHGLSAMAVSRNEIPEVDPCAYILHTIESRQSQVLSTTASMLEGDPNILTMRASDIKKKPILDDTAELSDFRSIHGGHAASWIRAAHHAINFYEEKIKSVDSTKKEKEDLKERKEETEKLIPHLEAIARLIADNPGKEQVRICNPALIENNEEEEEEVITDSSPWSEFSEIIKSPRLKWLDGTSAEAIYRDQEGNLEIPLRTLKALGEAFARGTVWAQKGMLHFSCTTRAFDAIKAGALVLDATPSLAVRSVVEAFGGTSTEIRAKQDSLKVRLIVSGNHGKTACSTKSSDNPDKQSSFDREKTHFLNTIKSLQEEFGTDDLAVLSHLSFIDSLKDDLTGVDAGHWGMHERGHNAWEKKKALLIWGVQQLSPSVAERQYMSDRQIVIEAGGEAWPVWDGTRCEERWYQIPGQKKKICAEGYKNDFIDFWHREWVTKKVVQAIGRLRAVRRSGEDLQVIIHASFPFTESFGLEFSTVEKPHWRTMSEYQDGRKSEQIEKGIIAFHATKGAGRRPVNDFLKSIGMTGISPNDWAEIKEKATGIRHEYSLFTSKTTPDLFGKDIEILIETIGNLVNFAKEKGMTLEDLVETGLVYPSYEEKIALMILRKSIFGDLVVGRDKKQEAS